MDIDYDKVAENQNSSGLFRKFKNPKARELFLKSLALDDYINSKEEENKKNGIIDDYLDELGWQACSLRVLADDIEDGIIDEEEIEL